jgi:predicted dehydrogenase
LDFSVEIQNIMNWVNQRNHMAQKTFNRREFLRFAGMLAGGFSFGGLPAMPLTSRRSRLYKAAVIGRTGGGNYGHGLDTVFNDFPNIKVVAVADVDEAGAREAARRAGAGAVYTDYRKMLEKESPDLVSIAMRQPQWHKDIALAAIETGAHLYIEKPITEYPEEADHIIRAASDKNVKIGVAHHMRYARDFIALKKLLNDGLIGKILEMRCHGKQDSRVGGEDLIVLGTHDLDYMRYLFGDPIWCSASISVDGKDIRPSDIHEGSEPYLVAGDTVRAQYAFPGNIHGYWSSVKINDYWNRSDGLENDPLKGRGKWGFDIYGTDGIIYYRNNDGIRLLPIPYPSPGVEDIDWQDLQTGKLTIPEHQTHPVRSLLHAIEHDSEPQCSATDARWAVEMVSAVYQSQIRRERIAFPLAERQHPLEGFKVSGH